MGEKYHGKKLMFSLKYSTRCSVSKANEWPNKCFFLFSFTLEANRTSPFTLLYVLNGTYIFALGKINFKSSTFPQSINMYVCCLQVPRFIDIKQIWTKQTCKPQSNSACNLNIFKHDIAVASVGGLSHWEMVADRRFLHPLAVALSFQVRLQHTLCFLVRLCHHLDVQ